MKAKPYIGFIQENTIEFLVQNSVKVVNDGLGFILFSFSFMFFYFILF